MIDLPGVAIFDHLRQHADEAGVPPDELALPDDDRVREGRWWASGSWDRSYRNNRNTSDTDRVRRVAGLLSVACRQPSAMNLSTLYTDVTDDILAGYVDALVELLTDEPPDALHEIGHWLATTAPDREPVKLGVTLLGVTGSDADLPVLRLLGAHSEFTFYCVTAMTRLLPDPEQEVWALARSLKGEGRIVCVEQLRDTEDPRIREWLLRDGFRNLNAASQLALIAATTGELLTALRGEVDRELLTAAGEIIETLLMDDLIDDYEHGVLAVEAFLGHMGTSADTVQDVSTVAVIRSYVADVHGEDAWRERQAAFTDVCDRILGWGKWPERVIAGLAEPDDQPAIWAARALGVDIFDALLEKITANPYTSDWYNAWLQANTARAGQLADLARTLLPIDRIATGPADEAGYGPAFRPHRALEWTVQALRDHPGIGGDLLLASLHSPVTTNRYMALISLKEWPRHTWPRGAAAAVEHAVHTDPDESTRRLAARLDEPPTILSTLGSSPAWPDYWGWARN